MEILKFNANDKIIIIGKEYYTSFSKDVDDTYTLVDVELNRVDGKIFKVKKYNNTYHVSKIILFKF